MHGVLLISVAAYRKARAIIGTLNGGAPPLFHIGPFYLFIWGGGIKCFQGGSYLDKSEASMSGMYR